MAARRKNSPASKFRIRRWRESRAKRSLRTADIVGRLHAEYPDADCALTFSSPWELLVATILSAQCTDERVNAETPALFARFPSPQSFAEADIAEIEELVRRTGFFRNKARAIKESAVALVEEFDGQLPRSMEELLTLRGVARKTANVVLGTAFGIAAGVVVDTHVSRLSQRLGLTAKSDAPGIEKDLMALVDQSEWVFFGHSLILHGRSVCKARRALCDECSLAEICPSALPD